MVQNGVKYLGNFVRLLQGSNVSSIDSSTALLVKLFPKTSYGPLRGSQTHHNNGHRDTTSTKAEFHWAGIVAVVVLCLIFAVLVVYRLVVSIHARLASRRLTFRKAIICLLYTSDAADE